MGFMETIAETLKASTQRAPETAGDDGSTGAYWCDGCQERVRDVAVDDRGLDVDDEGAPRCPSCGELMRFERTTGSGCAC